MQFIVLSHLMFNASYCNGVISDTGKYCIIRLGYVLSLNQINKYQFSEIRQAKYRYCRICIKHNTGLWCCLGPTSSAEWWIWVALYEPQVISNAFTGIKSLIKLHQQNTLRVADPADWLLYYVMTEAPIRRYSTNRAYYLNTARCHYNAASFRPIPHSRHPTARPWVWCMFCRCHCSALGNIMINRTRNKGTQLYNVGWNLKLE